MRAEEELQKYVCFLSVSRGPHVPKSPSQMCDSQWMTSCVSLCRFVASLFPIFFLKTSASVIEF